VLSGAACHRPASRRARPLRARSDQEVRNSLNSSMSWSLTSDRLRARYAPGGAPGPGLGHSRKRRPSARPSTCAWSLGDPAGPMSCGPLHVGRGRSEQYQYRHEDEGKHHAPTVATTPPRRRSAAWLFSSWRFRVNGLGRGRVRIASHSKGSRGGRSSRGTARPRRMHRLRCPRVLPRLSAYTPGLGRAAGRGESHKQPTNPDAPLGVPT
jgi:hypothetical protein